MSSLGLPTAEFMDIGSLEDGVAAGALLGWPYMLKRRHLGFNGTGNCMVSNENDVNDAFDELGDSELYGERVVDFSKELAVLVVLSADDLQFYPVVETVQKKGSGHVVICPAQIASSIAAEVHSLAKRVVSSFSGFGVYCIEFFLLPDDSLLINEVTPR